MGAINTHMQLTTITPYWNKETTMASNKLPLSNDFFKQLSQDYAQLAFMLRVQENVTFRATFHGHAPERQVLLYLVEQLEGLIFKTFQLKNKVEERLQEGAF
jgi:hypothetical protein